MTQEELLAVAGYRNQIRMLRSMMAELEEEVFARIDAGASIEPGALSARIREKKRGGRRERMLIVR